MSLRPLTAADAPTAKQELHDAWTDLRGFGMSGASKAMARVLDALAVKYQIDIVSSKENIEKNSLLFRQVAELRAAMSADSAKNGVVL